jgi:hypothetical protein
MGCEFGRAAARPSRGDTKAPAGYSGSRRVEEARLDDVLGAACPLETVAAARIAVAGRETSDDDHRRVATRYDELARTFPDTVTIAAITAFWL